MNRPAGFDAPSISIPAATPWHYPYLTPEDARAARNASQRVTHRQLRHAPTPDQVRARRRRVRLAKARTIAYAKVAAGSVLVVASMGWIAVWMAA